MKRNPMRMYGLYTAASCFVRLGLSSVRDNKTWLRMMGAADELDEVADMILNVALDSALQVIHTSRLS